MDKLPKLIVILDDHPITSEGIKNICSSAGWNCNIEAFTDEKAFFEFLKKGAPDLFLIDIQLKNSDGREVIKKLKKDFQNSKIIALSSFEDPIMINSAYSSGADAYIIKNATSEEMINGIISIWHDDKKYIQDQVKQAIAPKVNKLQKSRKINIPQLTSREKEVLKLIVEEKTTKEIAEALFLSDKTIESHRSNLFLKLDVKNSVGVVKKAFEWGLLNDGNS